MILKFQIVSLIEYIYRFSSLIVLVLLKSCAGLVADTSDLSH